MFEIVWRALAAYTFASILVLSSPTYPDTEIPTKPLVPCYDPSEALTQEVTQ